MKQQENVKADKKKGKNAKESKVDTKSKKRSEDGTYEQLQKLTNKKKEYLQEVIEDKNGLFTYEEDPQEYKRARK